MNTSQLSGLNLINHYKLSKSLCSMAWSSLVLILLYRRQSSANSLEVDETTDGKWLMKSKNKRGPKTVACGTPTETVVAADDWPSSITHCVRPHRKLVIQSWRWPWPHSVVVSFDVYCFAPCWRPWKSTREYSPSVLLLLYFLLGRWWKVLAGFQLIVASFSHVENQLIILVFPCVWLYDCGLCALDGSFTGALPSPFLKSGVMLADFHSSCTLPWLIEACNTN